MSDNDIEEALEEVDGENGERSGESSSGSVSGSVLGSLSLSKKQLIAVGLVAVVMLVVWHLKTADDGAEKGSLEEGRTLDDSTDVEVSADDLHGPDEEEESYRVPDGSSDELEKDAYILDKSGVFTVVGENGSYEGAA